MARKNSRKTTKKAEKSSRKYNLAFSLPSLFFWSFCLLFLLGWIFVLGILVGRGYISGEAKSIPGLLGRIAGFPNVTGADRPSESDDLKPVAKDPEFAFYEKLAVKKKEAARQEEHPRKKDPPGVKKTAEKAKTVESKPPSGHFYTLQLASFETEQPAALLVARLYARGYPAYLSKSEVKGKPYFRVRCGRFGTKSEAAEFLKQLNVKEATKGFVCRVD